MIWLNFFKLMTRRRALGLLAMLALLVVLAVRDYHLVFGPKPLTFIGQVEIPPEPPPSDEPILVDVPVYGDEDDGVLDPEMVIGLPVDEYLSDHPEFVEEVIDTATTDGLSSLAELVR